MMFFRKRMVPPTPPSLVKLYACTLSLMSGAGNSAPISDHVPELMYAHDVPAAGTAATAAAVSCDAGATTGTERNPVSAATDERSGPSTVPGCTSVPSTCCGSPNAFTSPYAQVFAVGSTSWLVLASVHSLNFNPVRKKWNRS